MCVCVCVCVCVQLLSHIQLFCNPIDCSLAGSSVHGISQARIQEWVTIYYSRGFSRPRDQTHVPCTVRWIRYNWATREAIIGSSVQSLSPVWLFSTPWTVARQASLSITNSWSLLKLMSIESVMPYNHLILCHPLLLLPAIFPSIRGLTNESVLPIRWPKYWSFSFSISPSKEYSGLLSFRIDWFDYWQNLFQIQLTSRVHKKIPLLWSSGGLVAKSCPTLARP